MNTATSMNEAYKVFVLAVDDIEWTQHWLDKLRCDQLIISVASRLDISPKIRIRAVESKATSKVEQVALSSTLEPFAEGTRQVIATLEALSQILSPVDPDPLIEDLRFSSFVEHLASVALSSLYPLRSQDVAELNVLRVISDLSLRKIAPPQEVQLDGAVVCTQYRAAVSRRVIRELVAGETQDWPVYLIRAGTAELDTLLGPQITPLLVEAATALSEDSTDDSNTALPDEEISLSGEVPPSPSPQESMNDNLSDQTTISQGGIITQISDQNAGEGAIIQLANDLYLACRRRDFLVDQPQRESVIIGPSLFTVSMALQAGSSLRPIEASVDDLAREVGVQSISVENDPERPFHIRFLVARRERQFPSLPETLPPLIEANSQSYLGLYLGRTLEGKDHVSFLSSWPHLLVGGATGSGKTTFLRSLLKQLSQLDPKFVKAAVIDGKGEIDYLQVLSPDHFIPHFPEVILGKENLLEVFEWLVTEEIPARRKIILERAMAASKERPLTAREMYVTAAIKEQADPFPPLFVVVDEFAELMSDGGPRATQFEQRVQQVTQVGRSVLVHLLLATQRPDASIMRGAIKANLDARVALRLPTHHDSTTILGGKGAERLLGLGDLIFRAAGQPLIRLQGYRA